MENNDYNIQQKIKDPLRNNTDRLNQLRIIVNDYLSFEEDKEWREDLINYIDSQIKRLAVKANSARKRNQKKKEKSDELTRVVYEELDLEKYQTPDQIYSKIKKYRLIDPKSRGSIAYRLGLLAEEGKVERFPVRLYGRMRNVYRRLEPLEGELEKDKKDNLFFYI